MTCVMVYLHDIERLVGNPPSGRPDKLIKVSRQRLAELQRWNEDDHPREPAGSPDGGQFGPGGGGGGGGGEGTGESHAKLRTESLGKNKITDDEQTAIQAYADYQVFEEINYQLRHGGSLDEEETQLVNDLHSAIEKSKLPRDIKVFPSLRLLRSCMRARISALEKYAARLLRYPEAERWHMNDVTGMREALRAALAGKP